MKILVVDDSKAMRMIIKRTLRQADLGAHEVVEAADGQEGLEAIRSECPNLVLSDWNMPKMTGIEMLRALRAEGNETLLGFVTSEATSEMKATAQQAGAVFFITKPFTVDGFQTTLSGLVR